MNLEFLNKTDMQILQSMFYRVKIKDYFKFLSMYVDKKFYEEQYKCLLAYSAADQQYRYYPDNEIEPNTEATIGDLLLIAKAQMEISDDYDGLEARRFEERGIAIVRALVIKPFYQLFATEKGKKTTSKLLNKNMEVHNYES